MSQIFAYHGGSFNASFDTFNTEGLGVHFGTREAALDRIGGKPVDDMIEALEVFEDENAWYFEVEGFGSDDAFATEKEAREAGERFSIDIGNDADASDELEITSVHLDLKNPLRLPDLGTWGIWNVIRELPEAMLTEADRDHIASANNISDDDGFEAFKVLLEAKGYDGIVYRNQVEDKGQDSYIAFREEQIQLSPALLTD